MSLPIAISPMHGISASYAFDNETVSIQLSGFYSTEDSETFITIAEQLTKALAGPLKQLKIRPSQIDSLLVTFDSEGKGMLYCNEFDYILGVLPARDLQKGEEVSEDDILDIEQMHLRSTVDRTVVNPPKDSALIFVFSCGWRKGLYFDFGPIQPQPKPLPDLAELFGTLFRRVQFQEKYRLQEEQWTRLTQWEWFPFSCLTKEEMRDLVQWSRQERYPESVLMGFCNRYKSRLPGRMAIWKRRKDLEDHGAFIDAAYDAYLKDNYIAAIQTIMPRIEGLMRVLAAKANPAGKVTQQSMVENLVRHRDEQSLFLPKRFQDYLLNSYFKGFDLAANVVPLSRHTVGHGVSRANDYSFMRNTVLFMVLDEILCFLPKS